MTSKSLDLRHTPLDGTTLIEASAGTGKTYTLTGLFLRLLLEKRLSVEQILVVTYTEAATEELRDRIRTRLADTARMLQNTMPPDAQSQPFEAHLWAHWKKSDAADLLWAASRNFDLAQIFTIHGFCQRMLAKNGFECQALFNTTLEPDLSNLIRQTCVDFWRIQILPLKDVSGAYIRSKITVDHLYSLATLPFLAQELRLETCEAIPDISAPSDDFAKLRDTLCAFWPQVRGEVRALLLAHPNLKQNMGSHKQLEQYLNTLDDYVRAPGLELSGDITKLTAVHMHKMTKKNGQPPEHELFDLLTRVVEAADQLKTDLDVFCAGLRRDFLKDLPILLGKSKAKRNVQGFDDLLVSMRQAVDNPALVQLVRAQYKAALIDEFQDTDGLQYTIFSRLFGHGRCLFLIGDPKQAIYSFRGADLDTYIRAGKSCERHLTLNTNYRSTPKLIEAVNRIFSHHPNPFNNPDILYQKVGWPDKDFLYLTEDGRPVPAMTLWHVQNFDDKPASRTTLEPRIHAAVVAEIGRLLTGAAQGQVLLGENPLQPRDITILVATHRQGELMHRALSRQNIHSVLNHSASVFESMEAKDLLAVLQAVAAYQHPGLLRTALVTPIFGLQAKDLCQLDTDGATLDHWVEDLAAWHGLWIRQGIMAALHNLLTKTKARPRLLALPCGERRMTNILHCLEILHAHERKTHASMQVLTRWFAHQIASNRRDEFQLRLDSDRDAVRIVTIHKSKGLEYPVVFCPFLYKEAESKTTHALVHEDGLVLDLGSKNFKLRQETALAKDQSERARLTYVALTRATCRCYLVWGKINKSQKSGPAWIFHGHRATPDNLSEKNIASDLQNLACPDLDVVALPQADPQPVSRLKDDSPDLVPRTWTRTLGPAFGLTSFSGLTRGLGYSARPGLDEADADGQQPEDMSMARFPRGATAGSCLHQIFEQIDFGQPRFFATAIRDGLQHFGLDPSWASIVELMLERVVSTDLGGFVLKDIDRRNCLVELEFLFPLAFVTPEDLRAVYEGSRQVLPPELPRQIERLQFEPRQGFLTGFVDLVVRHNDKFYLLDWKSNWLGPDPGFYATPALDQAMAENHYFLQYHLYCLALDRYLTQRWPEYEYTKHFGGVRYIFLRGIHPKYPGCGVYADRPDPAWLQRLGQTLFAEA